MFSYIVRPGSLRVKKKQSFPGPKGRCPLGNPARGRCPLGSRSGFCPDNPPGALPLDSAKGLRPSRHPGGYFETWVFPLRGSRRATGAPRRAACGLPLRQLRGAASADAGRGLCGHRRFAFDFRLRRTRHWRGVALCTPSPPCRLFYMETNYICGIYQNPHPEGSEGFQRAIAKPFGRRRSGEIPRRRPRVAARPLRAVTPAREPTRSMTPAWVSRGPKALRRVPKGAAPLWQVVRAAP